MSCLITRLCVYYYDNLMDMNITIFTDGAAKGNPGSGGYGAVVLVGEEIVEIGAGKECTTNNEMELKAVVEALKFVALKNLPTEIYSDSKYVIQGATAWIFNWLKNDWKTKSNTDVANKKLWMELVPLLKQVKITWHKVPGHVGIIGNERADTIASDFGDGKSVDLYIGSKSSYKYDIENTDYDKAEAEKRSATRKRQSTKAYSYISKVGSEIKTHATWGECEARVKGVRGTKFKKSISVDEEKKIIEEFSR